MAWATGLLVSTKELINRTPPAWSAAGVSRSVHVVRIDDDGEMILVDTPSTSSDLAGFESFRTSAWGSEAVRGLGSRYFPVLAGGNLVVAPTDVVEFLAECTLLRAHLGEIVPATDLGHSHEWYVEIVSARLSNIEQTAHRALEAHGGVLIR